jgi:hypothetical protein
MEWECGEKRLSLPNMVLLYYSISGFRELYRDGILGHQFKKRLEYFALCYSQSLLLADFNENHILLWFLNPILKNLRKKTRVYL